MPTAFLKREIAVKFAIELYTKFGYAGILEKKLQHAFPGYLFKVATFKKWDFEHGIVSCVLTNFIPETVLVCASSSVIFDAIEKVKLLNPWLKFEYEDIRSRMDNEVAITLHLTH
jgi:hypothetical protein